MIQYNDYELLYLMSEFDEEAERIFFEKYSNLIKARVHKFKIKSRYFDDFVQEGYYMLLVAIRTYDEYAGKSFNKYFDLILQRKFIKIIAKERHYFYDVDLKEDTPIIKDPNSFQYEIMESTKFSPFEEKVLILRKKKYRPKEIADILQCDVKVVYNCICRIKKKYDG